MARSTARPSCSTIWSRRRAGTLRSPRRRSASRRWALAMAASPPFTATYMSGLRNTGGAGQADHRAVAHEQQVDAAREAGAVVGPLGEEIAVGQWQDGAQLAVDAGALE